MFEYTKRRVENSRRFLVAVGMEGGMGCSYSVRRPYVGIIFGGMYAGCRGVGVHGRRQAPRGAYFRYSFLE